MRAVLYKLGIISTLKYLSAVILQNKLRKKPVTNSATLVICDISKQNCQLQISPQKREHTLDCHMQHF